MFNPTPEQITNNNLVQEGHNLRVIAGAGTGKSTQLRYFADQNPDKNFLVLCFNSANAAESNAHPDRPSNIWYSTFHSIAYREIVDNDMRKKLHPYLNYKDINQKKLIDAGLVSHAKDKKEEKEFLFMLCRGIMDAITQYCRSDSSTLQKFSQELYSNWFSSEEKLVISEDIPVKQKSICLDSNQHKKLAEITREYWLQLIDPSTSYSITHDVYLKLFQLRGFSINSFWDKENRELIDINVLCLDEAQDSNPVQVAIFNNTNHLQKIVVGDSMQQIYAWRGAINAMDLFNDYKTGHLTISFRFNQQIADYANEVLALGNSDMQLKGNYTKAEIKTKAILCRTNVQLLTQIALAAEQSKLIYTTTDLKELFSKMYHIQAVHFGNTPKYPNKSLRDIMTKESLDEALQVSNELMQLSKLTIALSQMGNGLSASIQKIKSCLVDTEQEAEYIVSTIHKSKGLEYDEVLVDDKLITFERDEVGDIINKEDAINTWLENKENLNLLYVAITRAKVKVVIPWYLLERIFEENLVLN